jgi:LicD family
MRYTDPDTILNLYQLLKDFHDFCEATDLEYWVGYGTLLGSVKHKGIIPWDDDADVFIRDVEKFASNLRRLEDIGYSVREWWFGYRIFVKDGPIVRASDGYHCPGCEVPTEDQGQNICDCKSCYPFIDVFVMKEDGDLLKHIDPRAEENFHGMFDIASTFPLKLYQCGEFEVYGPNDPTAFLNLVYGDDWATVGREGYQHDTKTYGEGKIFGDSWEPAQPTGPLVIRVSD